MATTKLPAGYERIDGRVYSTSQLQKLAYSDIKMSTDKTSLYGKPKVWHRWPLDRIFITQGFGLNPQIYARFNLKGHNGIDLRTRFLDSPLGHRIATASYTGVCEVRMDGKAGYGNHVRITHPDGSLTIYGHLYKVDVKTGDSVSTGQRVGITGNSGFSSGPHLHWEYRPPKPNAKNGYAGAVDPLLVLPPL